jgi:hypothetical protein
MLNVNDLLKNAQDMPKGAVVHIDKIGSYYDSNDGVKYVTFHTLKGKLNGNCNRTACQTPLNVVFHNAVMNAFYCPRCARLINEANPEYKRDHGVEMCVNSQPKGEGE